MAFVEFCKKEQPSFTKERKKQQQILSGPDNRDVQTLKKHCGTVKSMETVFPPFSVTGNTATHVLRQHTTIN